MAHQSERGVTIVEATIVLSVFAFLSAAMAPSIVNYVETARQARAREDIQVIGSSMQDFIADNGEMFFLRNGSNGAADRDPPTHVDLQRVDLLVSDGDIPSLAAAIITETYWTQAVNGTTFDTIENHLVENARFTAGVEPKDATLRYRNPTDITNPPAGSLIDFARAASSGFNAPYSWRGPYLRGPIDPDPWGNRYAVNVAFLKPSTALAVANISLPAPPVADYARMDVFAMSAGPDEEIDTRSAQDGAVPGDDDFIFIVSSNAK